LNVLVVPLPDLRGFRITSRSTDVIEDAARWALTNMRLAPDGRITLVGVSFGGGLTLVAAGRPSLAERLDTVVSLGGQGDLERVLRYLCSGVLPDGRVRPPHDYGVAIVALAAVPSLVPASQASDLERAILLYLQASVDESPDQHQASALLAEARRKGDAMPEPSRSIMAWINDRDVAALGRAIAPLIPELARDPALSPERSPATRAPVFLVQGLEDNVIPPSETPQLASYLARQGNHQVRWLLTPALTHVGLDPDVGPLDWWRAVRFWQALQSRLY
jgi:pimeloyl-ACP methyl ester carboxylesterase